MLKRLDFTAVLLPLVGIGLVLLGWTVLSQTVAPPPVLALHDVRWPIAIWPS